MIISVASGKGGTGKTTIATSLAAVLGSRAQLMDCDVEEPNCHILMKPVLETCESITQFPYRSWIWRNARFAASAVRCVDSAPSWSSAIKCSRSLKCVTAVEGCSLLCPEKAIREGSRELGVRETGFAGPVEFVHGRLRVGEAMSPPLIRAVKEKINPKKVAILDAPPGASCPVIHTVTGSDFVILVTEPTPFGLHDLKIAVEALSPLEIPSGVILNRSDVGDREVQEFCVQSGIPVLAEIPHSRKIAEGYAKGNLLVVEEPTLHKNLLGAVHEDPGNCGRTCLSSAKKGRYEGTG